jgi:hypothetical protein
MRPPRRQVPRDQEASVFSAVLLRLCAASGALGAALVDGEGETVDYAGGLSPYDVRVAAAEWRIVLSVVDATRSTLWPGPRELVIRSARRSFAVVRMSEGYAVVLVLPRGAFHVSRRALAEAEEALESEAGLAPLAGKAKLRWSSVEVRVADDESRRPAFVWHEGLWRPITILGRFQSRDLERREEGYLARFATGPELLLVREPLGRWFAGRPT